MKKHSKVDELAKLNLFLDAKQKLVKNSKLFELSINPRDTKLDERSFNEVESILQVKWETYLFDIVRRLDPLKNEGSIDFRLYGSLYDEDVIKILTSFFATRNGPKKLIPIDIMDYSAK